MSIAYSSVPAALAALFHASHAIAQLADPADPAVTVPAPPYRSAFADYRHAAAAQTPDKMWRSANEEMQRLGGHMGHLKVPTAPPDHGTHQAGESR